MVWLTVVPVRFGNANFAEGVLSETSVILGVGGAHL